MMDMNRHSATGKNRLNGRRLVGRLLENKVEGVF